MRNRCCSAVFGKFATNAIGGTPGNFDAYQFAATVVAGGVGSAIAGGKFENGAVTAAYGYLFNYLESTREHFESQKSVNQCASQLICMAGDVGGNGYAKTEYPGPNPTVKWGAYDCNCSSDGQSYQFVGPGKYLDKNNLLGVDEITGKQLNRRTGEYSTVTISKTARPFTVDLSSRVQRWWFQDFIRSFSTNNQMTPSR